MTLTDAQIYRYVHLNDYAYSGDRDVDIKFRRVRIVKTRKPHECPGNAAGELHPLPIGTIAVADSAKCDGMVGTCYTCLPCLDKWAEECGYDIE